MTVKEVIEQLKQGFGYSFDFTVSEGLIAGRQGAYFYFDGMLDKELLEIGIIRPLREAQAEKITADVFNNAKNSFAEIIELTDINAAKASLVTGDTVFFCEDKFFSVNLRKYQARNITEPPTASVLKGPREGFTEDVMTNISLIRKRLKTPDLIISRQVVGRYTGTNVCICYLSSVASSKIVDTVTERIKNINIDGIIDSSYIAQLIEDDGTRLFSQFSSQEKPDIVVAKMLEGRVAIIVEGSPMVLTVPCLLTEAFQDSQDYYKRSIRVTVTRALRILGLIIAVLLPAFFVGVQEYQYQMLPLKFTITVLNAINGTPLTPTLEMFFVLLIFDMLNEASIRMPKYVGMALSIVGAIVLGETAVNAGLLSSPAVLVTALSSIGLYTAPDNMGTFSIMRLAFLLGAATLGIFGLMVLAILFVAHTVCLKSFDTNFVAPFAPIISNDWKDGIFKSPLKEMISRPYSIPTKNRRRQK